MRGWTLHPRVKSWSQLGHLLASIVAFSRMTVPTENECVWWRAPTGLMLFLLLQFPQFVPLVTLNPNNSTFSAAWWVWGTCYLCVALHLLLSLSSLLLRMRGWVFFLLKANWFLKLTPGMWNLGRNWHWHLLDWPSESCPDGEQVVTGSFQSV